ncbi:MAG TPA: glycerol kinase GlpK [Candidatus Baltobacteraceae bacterium]|nr:glycerol kinase GlpK [Candidatus Baltobacteraceae bacterium]
MDPVVLALDQGTTSSRALVFDRQARILAVAQAEFEQIYPKPAWVEHDPQRIWDSQYQTARQALQDGALRAQDVAAIGIANQRETVVLWDRRTWLPVANAIVWQDRRTAGLCGQLKDRGLAPLVQERTGLVIDPYFSATKIAWLLQTVDGLRDRAERGEIAAGTIDTWLIWRLTGGKRHVTDVTNASRTMLFDIHRLVWDAELCDALEIPQRILPEVLPSAAEFGTCDPQLFGAAIPICSAVGDQQAALAGQAGFAPGLAKNTYGTGSFLMTNTGTRAVRSSHGLLTTIALGVQPGRVTYALEGSVFSSGSAVQWLRDGLGIIDDAAQSEVLARQAADNGGVYFVPAFTGMGAPYWDPYARAAIVGITRGTTRAHIARAALEAIAFQSAELIGAMQQDAGFTISELRVDGGGSNNALAMQFQADLLDVPVVRPENTETTAFGAACIAGLQAGVWPGLDEVAALWREHRRFTPAMNERERATALHEWRRAVQRAAGWARTE